MRWGEDIRASAQIVALQNSSNGESGVITTDPTPRNSVAFSSPPAMRPARRPGSRRSAASASSRVPSAAAKGPSRRTPSGVSPASAVPTQIHNATIGG